MVKKIALIALTSVSIFALSSCASEPKTEQTKETVTLETSTTVTAEGVLTAAVILSSGNIEDALAKGIVTPDEVVEAEKAIKTNTLNDWKIAAQK